MLIGNGQKHKAAKFENVEVYTSTLTGVKKVQGDVPARYSERSTVSSD